MQDAERAVRRVLRLSAGTAEHAAAVAAATRLLARARRARILAELRTAQARSRRRHTPGDFAAVAAAD